MCATAQREENYQNDIAFGGHQGGVVLLMVVTCFSGMVIVGIIIQCSM
jgi:hypothetical protein